MKLELPQFHQASVLVLGDVMLDRYWEGPASRISPEAPVPVVVARPTWPLMPVHWARNCV